MITKYQTGLKDGVSAAILNNYNGLFIVSMCNGSEKNYFQISIHRRL